MDLMDFELKAKAAFEQIDDKARQMGMYSNEAHGMQLPNGDMVLIVDFIVGDIAFTDRVQNPERYATDNAFRTMEKGMQSSEFLSEHERIKQALAAGKDPLAALDDDDTDLGN